MEGLKPAEAPGSSGSAGSLWHGLAETAEMIKLQHTIFGLPFAIVGLITAVSGWPRPATWLWVLVAMVAARTAAMSFNRLADHQIDAINPRTADRSLPARRLGRGLVWAVTLVSCLVFVAAAGLLNRLCLILALPTLAVLLGYSYAKRFTSAAHLWLGLALGIAPSGAWIAASGSYSITPLVLTVAVTLWVAGFDIIYSLQDEGFDREHGLRSIPARLGAARALGVSRVLHGLAFIAFGGFAILAGGGWLRMSAVLAAGALLGWQHRLVEADDLSAVDAAFFTANGVLSLIMCLLFVFAKIVGT